MLAEKITGTTLTLTITEGELEAPSHSVPDLSKPT